MLVGCMAIPSILVLCSGGTHRRRIILITLLDTPPGIWTGGDPIPPLEPKLPMDGNGTFCIGPI
jgi:hypothetical protein